MKVLIIEDEKAAVRNLKALLADVAPEYEIADVTDSIIGTIEWLGSHPVPDLIFMDIHLADGSAFEIFEHIKISCPIIFTTAYDEYALKAFRVNSVDYLLKPIGVKDMRRAIEKLKFLQSSAEKPKDLSPLVHTFSQKERYKTYFLIPQKGSKLLPLPVNTISYFYISDGIVKAVTQDQNVHLMPQSLDELMECIDPEHFFRINRQCILSRESIQDIDLWFSGRLSVNLKIATEEKILVSKARVTEFKAWFSGD